ncbi:hypothetical protein Ahy_A05g025528 [Arachis hypogaea]|uniref:Uncharacterized protein n=1 Tax=Arachis hypogaea TaxID=3818 RepID=A0A445D8Y4_ARAHY|nr:hypothetical protein Ahy_A05g025528 [Arachis hypogaea]
MERDDIYQAWKFRAVKHLQGMLHAIRKKGARPYWILPEVLGELMRHWDTDAYRQLQARNTAARKLTRGTSLHTAGGTTFPKARLHLNHSLGRPSRMDELFEHTHTRKEDRTQWVDEHSRKTKDIFQERIFQAEQERQTDIEADVTDPPPIYEESIWIEIVGRKRRGRVYGMGKLEDRYQMEKREWQQTTESLREDLNTSNSQMDQFSHQLSSLTEYVRAMGPSSSGSRVPPPSPFTFPSSQKSTAIGRKLPPILSDQNNHRVLKGTMILMILMTRMII